MRLKTLPDQLADAIVEGIAAGALQPGQRLIEVELAREFEVSRVPLREALKTLEAQGILEREPHRGVRIVQLDETRIDRICEVRAALESIALRDAVAVLKAEPGRRDRLDRILAGMADAVARGDWIAVNRADVAFHHEICLLSGNEIVMTLWQSLARHVMMIFGREILSNESQSEVVEHHRAFVADALARSGDHGAAVEEHILRLRRRAR